MSSKIILVTGPPLNGRDEYIQSAIQEAKGIAYFHVFDYMKKKGPAYGLANLTRENILNIASSTLDKIRNDAFKEIAHNAKNAPIALVSTPARFHLRPSAASPSGIIDGFNEGHIQLLDPKMIIIFIADLLEVKSNLSRDSTWNTKVDSNLKTIANWRKESINVVMEIRENFLTQKNVCPLDVVIFSKGHDYQTFVDLIEDKKPRIYLSYHITGVQEESINKIGIIRDKLKEHFICIDPYAIKDWDIINAYDKALESGSERVEVVNQNVELYINEVNDAIDEIRAQTVYRDYKLIESTHATVVCHLSDQPSYGVMSEIIYTRAFASNPVYVLYPWKKRPSPFFEFYASDIIRDGNIDQMTGWLIDIMKRDITNGLWPRLSKEWKEDLPHQ